MCYTAIIQVPVLFSASLIAMSSSTVGSERPFWFTLYAIRCRVGAASIYDSDGDKSVYGNEKKEDTILYYL